jgi:16S rRNA (cytosine1402-N4)-methyltransferase
MQLDQGKRGFSFSKEGPLDMRMDPDSSLTASDIVNHWSEEKLATIFREYGEERHWRRAAKAIVHERKKRRIETTTQLASILMGAIGYRRKKKLHPATLIFQALRIAVNGELDAIQTGLKKAIQYLTTGGRIGVISFHRLEDRIVKTVFKMASMKNPENEQPVLKLLTKRPLVPSFAERRFNPRSRSAKMRFAEKIW